MAQPPHRDLPAVPFYYGRSVRRTLRAATAVIRPRDELFDQAVDDAVVEAILSFVPYMPAPLRVGLRVASTALEYAPALFGYGMKKFSSLSEEEAVGYLERWARGPMPLSLFFESLRELVMVCFYQQPEVLAALEIDWQGRSREQVARRARLQAMAPDLANPRNAPAGSSEREGATS